MTFLQSIFLYGLIAAALPLLIHLFSRRKIERISFSSLYFLRLLESKRIRNIKLRQFLLLLVRMLIVAFLVLVFARPTLTGSFGSHYSDDSPVSAVFILDNSLSASTDIEGVSLFELIKQQALSLANTFKDGDEVFILLTSDFGEETEQKAFYDIDLVRRQIVSAETSNRTADLVNAVQTGYNLLSSSVNLYREIFLISDMQEQNFSDENPDFGAENEAYPVSAYCITPVRIPYRNLGITGAEIKNQILERGKQFTLRVNVRNFGDDPVHDVLVSLYFDGKRVAQQDVIVNEGDAAAIDFQIIPEKAGIIGGMVEIEDDVLSKDNRRYFVVTIPEKIPVLLIGGNPDAQIFLESVFSPEMASPLIVTAIDQREITTVDFKDFSVVVFNGFASFSESDIYRIRNFCAAGGGVVIFPSELSDIASFNRTIGNAFSLPQLEGFTGRLLDTGIGSPEFLLVDKLDFEHPVFANMFQQELPELDLPRVYYSLDIMPGINTRSIMTLSNNRPFIAETRVEQGAVIVFSSAPSLSWNTLPLKGMFAPLLHRIVQYLSMPDAGTAGTLNIGGKIIFLYIGAVDEISMISPGGDVYSLNPAVSSDAYRIEFAQTEYPGIYKFSQLQQVKRKFAVNVDRRESDLHPVTEGRLRRFFGGAKYRFWVNEPDIVNKIRESRSGREISKYFLAAIIIFLLIETLLQFDRRPPEPEEPAQAFKEESRAI